MPCADALSVWQTQSQAEEESADGEGGRFADMTVAVDMGKRWESCKDQDEEGRDELLNKKGTWFCWFPWGDYTDKRYFFVPTWPL